MDSHNHYNILRISKYCLITYNNVANASFFESLRKKNFLINLVYTIHKLLKPSFFSYLMIVCQGAKAYLSVRCNNADQGKIMATAIWTNERKQIDYIESCIGKEEIIRIEFGLRTLFCKDTLSLIWLAIKYRKKLWQYIRIVRYINHRYDFMPSCMTVMGISYYFRFLHELKRIRPAAILTTSFYSPDATALFFAAQKLGIKTIYVAHAFTPPNVMIMRLDYNLMILQSPQVLDNCSYSQKADQAISFLGLEAEFSPMRLEPLQPHGMRVGIFLSAPVNTSKFKDIIDKVHSLYRPSSLLIRMHPEALSNIDLGAYITAYPNIKITFGTPLIEDVAECDIGLVGVSGVTLQLLRMGLPCVYYALFEPLPYDYCGFVSAGILLETTNFDDISIDTIKGFYQNCRWKENFLKFDPFYGEDVDRVSLVRKEFALLSM